MIDKLARTTTLMCMIAMIQVGCASTGTHSEDSDEVSSVSVNEAIRALHAPAPILAAPVQIAATVAHASSTPGSNATLIVKANILPGWHIYAQVPPGQPYAVTSLEIAEHPDAVRPVGDWALPESHPSLTSPDMLEYTGTAVFTHALSIDHPALASGDAITVTISFQACDMAMCLPPQRLTLRPAVHSD